MITLRLQPRKPLPVFDHHLKIKSYRLTCVNPVMKTEQQPGRRLSLCYVVFSVTV